MVLKHTPLGEINLPFVASSANAPRCRRNRRSFSRRQWVTLHHFRDPTKMMPCVAGAADDGCRHSARWPRVRRGGAKSAKIEIFYFSLILSALRTIISHYFSLSLIISHYLSPHFALAVPLQCQRWTINDWQALFDLLIQFQKKKIFAQSTEVANSVNGQN